MRALMSFDRRWWPALLVMLAAGCSGGPLSSVLVVTVSGGDGDTPASTLRFRVGKVSRSVKVRFPAPGKDKLVVGLEGLPGEISGNVALVVEALDQQCVLGRSPPVMVRIEVGGTHRASAVVQPLSPPECGEPAQPTGVDDGGAPDDGPEPSGTPDGGAPPDGEAPLTCGPGEHPCGGACVRDDNVLQCGSACRRCVTPTGGTVTCENAQCTPRCPAGKRLCGDDCVSETVAVQNCPCPSGKHKCGDRCVDDALPTSCGQRCEPCPLPPNAVATCTAGSCGFTCATGYHRCGDACLPDDATASCGTRCTPCEAPANGTTACVAGACKPSCPSDRQLCDGACIPQAAACGGRCTLAGTRLCPDDTCRRNDVNACGSSCNPCRPPAFGTATCNSGTCGFVCRSGYKKCGSACIDEDSCCSAGDCRPPSNAEATCDNGQCEWSCRSDYVRCDDTCISPSQCCNADASIDINTNGVADCKENLLPNSQFKSQLAPWKLDGWAEHAWSSMDAKGSGSSGSIRITNVYDSPTNGSVAGSMICIPGSANTTYTASADYFIPAGQPIGGSTAYEIVAYSGAGCTEEFLINIPLADIGDVVGSWSRGSVTFTTPANTKALWIRLEAVKKAGNLPFTVHFDNVLLVK